MRDHEGRVAIVTGGSSGIGRAAVLALAEQGSAVVVHGLDAESARATVAEVVGRGGRAGAVWGRIDRSATSADAVDMAVSCFGAVDTLVTSAGIQRYGDVVGTSDETWDEIFDVNVKGVFFAARAALPLLRESAAGSIAIISSVQALATQTGVAAYTASKGALNAFARAMAVDEGRFGIRVNTVLPGSVDTPMLRASASLLGGDGAADAVIADWGRSHVLGRVGRPAELGEVVAFVTGPRASFMTGAEVRVDGGLLARSAAPMPSDRASPTRRVD
jgi:NAD(P)-dependent dehydrogenase (short-subunit alcohol dehydrogenase family)